MSYGSKLAAQAGFAPAPFRLTGGRTTVIPLSRTSKLVTAAGLAPAVTWSQARHVAATLRGVAPAHWERKPGAWFFVETRHGSSLGRPPRRRLALSMGLAPTLFPQTTGCFSIQLRERNGLPGRSLGEGWWEVLVTLQFVASDTFLKTPDLQSGSRITSLKIGAGVGVAPTEAEFMRLA